MSDNTQNGERRHYSRVEFEADCELKQGDRSFHAQLVDISLNGVLLQTPERYQLRTDLPCKLHIQLASEVNIDMQVRLIHSSNTLLGFHCTSIDMDSIVHLRRLLEMNLDVPDASERVLTELLQRHQPPSH